MHSGSEQGSIDCPGRLKKASQRRCVSESLKWSRVSSGRQEGWSIPGRESTSGKRGSRVCLRNGKYLNAGDSLRGKEPPQGHQSLPGTAHGYSLDPQYPCSLLSNYTPSAFLSCSCSRQLLWLFSLHPLSLWGTTHCWEGRGGGLQGELLNTCWALVARFRKIISGLPGNLGLARKTTAFTSTGESETQKIRPPPMSMI